MGSRVHKYHGRANRNQRLKRQRIINIITLIFIVCVGILILGVYGVLPLPKFIDLGEVAISSNTERYEEFEQREEPKINLEGPTDMPVSVEQTEITEENAPSMKPEKTEGTEITEITGEAAGTEDIKNEEAIVPNILENVDVNKPMIALTFDDGPSQYTWPILAALDNVGGRATFFVVGNRVASHNAALQQILAVGCEIGNHSYSHPDLTKLDTENMKAQIKNTDDALEKAVQIRTTLLRPPYGAVNDELFALAEKPLILWSVDPKDWQNRDKDYLVEYMMLNAHDGDIVLLHDIHETTALAAQEFIPKLVEKGYQLVTVSELLAAKGVEAVPGKIYRGRVFLNS
ncbi:MAG: polysaccharide deacetylase family protein [Peptococcaceae bacterium]|nr:polysaccharide deacetylase family protein [Peptococcaceae bacterium]